ncbi:hypothetical protein DFH07DRAFT_776580 [Mycena maculata]|uniref:Alpha-type protein kinase domain-containing protein n=1 Tax=Mycena maculata TaxID=230809 RepID=A0AAD7ILW7_9AGAR|nr:hypothetical protein DFH07DRAFT_776580 [Mycena maculata]
MSVAVSHDQASGNNVANTSSLLRTYLVEEVIDTDSEDFVKVVHNGNAVPLLALEDPLYNIAQFLCFTQHIQYFKNDGAVFLSDLQDPQIMMEISGNKNIFGDGNVGKVFTLFPKQHICNKYCEWFKLPTVKESGV